MSEMDRELLERYLSGDASPDECARVEAWLAEDPERWTRLGELREGLEDAALSESAVDEAKADVWTRLTRKIGWDPSNVGRPRRQHRRVREFVPHARRPWLTGWSLAAAVFVAVIGGSAIGVLLLRWRPSAVAVAVRVAATKPGERAEFRLSDGTQVVLGVASTLQYPAAFLSGPREVSLQGEAYFDVIHDESRPFTVRAGDLVAKDLGTEFTVRAYPEDVGARVVVRKGRVAIRAAAKATGAAERVVAAGQLGRLGPSGEPTTELADTTAWFAWTEGRLVFTNTPLREAVRQVERWRDVEILLAPGDIGERQFTTSFGNESTSAILQVIGTGLHLDVIQTGPRSFMLRAK
jgi:transmembrane sensor